MTSWTKTVVKLFAGAAVIASTVGGSAALAADAQAAASSRWHEGERYSERYSDRYGDREEYRGGGRYRDRDRDHDHDYDYDRDYDRDHDHCEKYVVTYSLDCERTYRADSRREAIDLTKALRRYGVSAHRHGRTVHFELDCEKRVTLTDHDDAHELEDWLEDLGFHVHVIEEA